MRFIDGIAGVPPHGIVSPVLTSDGLAIRVARWPAAPSAARAVPLGTVVVLTGRTEFIEKYFEVATELRGRGFETVVFDWRGQGKSDRALRDTRKGHVESFARYERDVAALAQQVLEPFCPRPWFGLAHSMGGAVALSVAAKEPGLFQRLVLSAPMIAIARLRFEDSLRVTARLCRLAGLGGQYIPGGHGRAVAFTDFEGNPLTSDPDRYARVAGLLRAEPGLSVAAPTIAWIDAAFAAMRALHGEAFARAFRTPSLTVMPGADRVVDVRAAERLMGRLRGSQVVVVPGAQHEILMERDVFRQQFWAAFDAFIPGAR